MKTSIILFALIIAIFSFDTSAQNRFTVLTRQDHSSHTMYREVELLDLESEGTFDGKYVRIVRGKGKEPIKFTDGNEIVTKAATVYYHLQLARAFWKEKISSSAPGVDKKIIVRLEISNLFDEQGHFAHDNRDPQFNNALSIPEGETPTWVPEHRRDKWEKEIWFRPMKRISTEKFVGRIGVNPLTQTLNTLEKPFINYTENRFTQSMVEHVFYPSYADRTIGEEALIFAGTIAMTKVIIEASKSMDRLFMDDYFYLDTAMVPEVIYHEYAHIILSDHLRMTHSTPVVEGMADYFAATLANKKKTYAHVRGRSNSKPKDPQSRQRYSHWLEANFNASGDFVLAVLWDVREVLGVERGNRVIYEARKDLTTDADINSRLIRALMNSCATHCQNPRVDRLKLYEKFGKRGF